jgi:peptidoglycan/xylan/chitin deacetylase (PgdA/CDA1 family)
MLPLSRQVFRGVAHRHQKQNCEISAISMKPAPGQAGLRLTRKIAPSGYTTPLSRSAIRAFLYVMRALGAFQLARYFTRRGLRIICYHGFALGDEYRFRSTLFIKEDLFRRRVAYLRDNGYPILPLGEALEALYARRLPPRAVVITMDDGWLGVYSIGFPIIKQLRVPVTIYVATDYVENPMPVYTVASAYLFWRTRSRQVTLPRDLGTFDLDLQADEAEGIAQKFGAQLPPAERLAFLRELADALDVPFADIERQQLFRVMDEQQLRRLDEAGVDIQLHSHRHEWPLYDRGAVESEIAENRRLLEPIASHPLEHFCYPSGVYGLHQAEWLAALGVKSATTIEPGLNFADTSRFALRRIVDGGKVSDVEFAAEMTGFMEAIRWFRHRRMVSRPPSRSVQRRSDRPSGAVS